MSYLVVEMQVSDVASGNDSLSRKLKAVVVALGCKINEALIRVMVRYTLS